MRGSAACGGRERGERGVRAGAGAGAGAGDVMMRDRHHRPVRDAATDTLPSHAPTRQNAVYLDSSKTVKARPPAQRALLGSCTRFGARKFRPRWTRLRRASRARRNTTAPSRALSSESPIRNRPEIPFRVSWTRPNLISSSRPLRTPRAPSDIPPLADPSLDHLPPPPPTHIVKSAGNGLTNRMR